MTRTHKGIVIGVVVGIVLGITLFFSALGIIENIPDNNLFWTHQYADSATQQAVLDLAIQTSLM